jgi:hypothetical protein
LKGYSHQQDGEYDHQPSGGSTGHGAWIVSTFETEPSKQQQKHAAAGQAGQTGDEANTRKEGSLSTHAADTGNFQQRLRYIFLPFPTNVSAKLHSYVFNLWSN